jgi:uncharacterized membrane protein YfcA
VSEQTSTDQAGGDQSGATNPSGGVTRVGTPVRKPAQLPGIWQHEPAWVRRFRYRINVGPRLFAASVLAVFVAIVVILVTVLLAPAEDRSLILEASLFAIVAGAALTSVGVYGGVLVPGLLLLGVHPLFAAPLSLFLQVLIVPFGAGAHIRLGNVSRPLVIPLVAGGIIGAILGPIVASFFSADAIRLAVEVLIIVSAVLLLVSLPLKNMRVSRADGDVPALRVGVIGTASGIASGISGAGWGPMGVTMLILSRIEPRVAVGSSVFGRIFMAAAAVLSAAAVLAVTPGLYDQVQPEWVLVPSILAASLAAMLPGAILASRLGRTRMSVLIATISIALASAALINGLS